MSDQEISIIHATEEDVDAIATFFWTAWKESGPDAPGYAGATDETVKELTARENLAKRIGGPDRRMFIAMERDRIVGFSANRRMDSELVELAGLVVLESRWGRGIGTRLFKAAVEAARQDGYRQMRVRTEADNYRAIRFYESKSFTFVKSLTEEIGDVTVEGWELVRDL